MNDPVKAMTLSVVVPTADRPDLLAQCLDSIAAQTHVPSEVVVIDNGETAVPDEIIECYDQVTFHRLRPRIGAPGARNIGVDRSSGELIAFLDDDDLWPPEYLERMVATLQAERADMVAAPRHDADTGGVFERPVRPDRPGVVPTWRQTGYTGSNIVVRRSAMAAVDGFRERLITGEDRALFIDLCLSHHRIVVCDETRSLVRQHRYERLTDDETLMQGKLMFLRVFGGSMPAQELREERFAILVYMSRTWRWPVFAVGGLMAPTVFARRLVKIFRPDVQTRFRRLRRRTGQET